MELKVKDIVKTTSRNFGFYGGECLLHDYGGPGEIDLSREICRSRWGVNFMEMKAITGMRHIAKRLADGTFSPSEGAPCGICATTCACSHALIGQ
jgi:hypothetical protein